jgi:hypothetical protein
MKRQGRTMVKITKTRTEAFLTNARMNAANWRHTSVAAVVLIPVPL